MEEKEETGESYLEEIKERGKIRSQLKSTIENMEYLENDLADIKKPKFQNMNQSLNETFEKIHHPRELTLDAVGLKILSHSLKTQALKLSDLSKQYNFETFAMKLKEGFGVSENGTSHTDRRKSAIENCLDWTALGIQVGSLLAAPRPVSTMVGPFQKEEKIRKAPKKRSINEEDTKNTGPEKPTELKQEGDEDMNEATNQRVHKLLKVVRERTDEALGKNVSRGKSSAAQTEVGFNLLELLVDPVDDVQTVENFFDFAFLIKEKQVVQALDDNDLPIAIAADEKEVSDNLPKRQMVLTLTTKELKEIRELLYGPNASKIRNPLHRDDEVYQTLSSLPAALSSYPSSSSATRQMNSSSSHGGKENNPNRKESFKRSTSSPAVSHGKRKLIKLDH